MDFGSTLGLMSILLLFSTSYYFIALKTSYSSIVKYNLEKSESIKLDS